MQIGYSQKAGDQIRHTWQNPLGCVHIATTKSEQQNPPVPNYPRLPQCVLDNGCRPVLARGAARRVHDGRVCAMVQQYIHGLCDVCLVRALAHYVQGSEAVDVELVGVGSMLQEQGCDGQATLLCCEMQWRPIEPIASYEICTGAVLQKSPGHVVAYITFSVAFPDGQMQCSGAMAMLINL